MDELKHSRKYVHDGLEMTSHFLRECVENEVLNPVLSLKLQRALQIAQACVNCAPENLFIDENSEIALIKEKGIFSIHDRTEGEG